MEPLWFTFPFEILSPFAGRYVFTAYCVYPVLAKRRLTVEDLSSRFPLRPVSIFIWLFTRVFFFLSSQSLLREQSPVTLLFRSTRYLYRGVLMRTVTQTNVLIIGVGGKEGLVEKKRLIKCKILV